MTDDLLPEPFARLSHDAKGICGAWFGMMPACEGKLVFHMKKSRPSDRSAAALDELVAAGIVKREPHMTFGAVRYVPLIDCSRMMTWLRCRLDDPALRFPLTVAIEADEVA